MGASATNRRDETAPPNWAERMARLEELNHAYALAWSDVALSLGVPLSTLDMLRAEGRGPRVFKIGRRIYTRQADLRAWLDEMAKSSPA